MNPYTTFPAAVRGRHGTFLNYLSNRACQSQHCPLTPRLGFAHVLLRYLVVIKHVDVLPRSLILLAALDSLVAGQSTSGRTVSLSKNSNKTFSGFRIALVFFRPPGYGSLASETYTGTSYLTKQNNSGSWIHIHTPSEHGKQATSTLLLNGPSACVAIGPSHIHTKNATYSRLE